MPTQYFNNRLRLQEYVVNTHEYWLTVIYIHTIKKSPIKGFAIASIEGIASIDVYLIW